jgi:catechol 2,3-dioxygenase-like lactoylglutathione lyase family enzyme
MQSRLTHFALHVADAEASARFHEDIAGMRILRSWANQDGSGLTEAPFVLVLLEGSSPFNDDRSQRVIGPLSHFGFELPSRDAVEEIARRGKAAGILQMPPRDAGPIVGYHCYLRDPDGHSIEFSFGQVLE